MRHLAFLLPLLLIGAAAPAQKGADQRAEWNQPVTPFRIAGNVHYVGTAGVAAYLITDPRGHVLIDGGLPESAPHIAESIRKLGLRVKDVRILLINHAHYDHAGGLAELKRLSGAQLLASAGDRRDLERGKTVGRADLADFPPVRVDRTIGEGSHIRLGRIDLVTHLTPGHTKGCTSWSMRVVERGKPLDILFACSLTVAGQALSGSKEYPAAAADFRRTFAALRRMRADMFLNFHSSGFAPDAKRARLEAGDPLAFVDPGELARQTSAAEAAFEAELARQKAKRQ